MLWPGVVRLRRRRLVADEEGAVLVEFGILVPILMLFFVAIIDFGFAVYTLNALAMAVREGGRYAAILPGPIASDDLRVQRVVAQAFNAMNVSQEALDESDVVITPPDSNSVIRVSVPSSRFAYIPLIPIAEMLDIESIPMGRVAAFRWERGE